MRVESWNPEKYDREFINIALDRLEDAAEIVAERARAKVPVGTISRPRGRKEWSERTPGSLKASIRVVRKRDGGETKNVRVYAGSTKTYYARFVEFGTIKMPARPFLRPALNGSKSAIRAALEK